MECLITWQLEPENSGLFSRKPIINSLFNKTKEPKEKNEERKLAEQELHAYACYNKPNPRLSNSITLRRGTFTSSFPHICVEVHAYAWEVNKLTFQSH
ncbi:hypothetical protein PIB30_100874, partial [Stylosanthes scabra]|nr:hypothetical protein [Stylosanthes scabra]